eukprot:scaffold217067_cov23-Tisochrysis_lutea.AAC.1
MLPSSTSLRPCSSEGAVSCSPSSYEQSVFGSKHEGAQVRSLVHIQQHTPCCCEPHVSQPVESGQKHLISAMQCPAPIGMKRSGKGSTDNWTHRFLDHAGNGRRARHNWKQGTDRQETPMPLK